MCNLKKRVAALVAFVAMTAMNTAHAAYEFVAVDGTTGEVTFTPGKLVTPVLTGIVSIIGAIGAIWVIRAGVRWMKRFIGG